MAKLEVCGLNFYFGFSRILKEINLVLESGKIVSIVGPSGGGKTTLLKVCAGLLDVSEGEVKNDFSSFAFAFQDARLLPWKNTLENIMFPLSSKLKYKELKQRAVTLALKFGLDEADFDKYPKDLSGGMRQRVSFARALIGRPDILFLDEPFSALDIGLKRELQDFVLSGKEEYGTGVLFITHDLMEAVRMSDSILLLKSDPGEIIKKYEIDTPAKERDDAFVFAKTREFLEDDDVIRTFEIKM